MSKFKRFMANSAAVTTVIAASALGSQSASAAVQFNDEAVSAGVATPGESYGASWGDLNGDGFPDLFVSNHRTQPAVYVNLRNGTFFDNSTQVKTWVNRPNADTHGGTWADFDNDGDDDLMVTTGTGNDQQFFINDRGDLVDRTVQYGISVNNVGGRLAMWLDYNRDSLMDFIDIQFGGIAQLFRQTPNGFVNDTVGSNVVCDRAQYGHLLDANGDGELDIVCAYDSKFPRKIYSTTTYPLTNITWAFPQVPSVADSIVADFDNNGEMDVFLLSNTQLRPSGVSQPSAKVMEALLSNGNKGFNFVSAGQITVKLDWNRSGASDSSSTDFTRVVVGANRLQLVTGSPFTLDSTDPNVQGVPPADPSQVPTLRIGYDAAAVPPRWVFVVDSINGSGVQVFSEAYLQVSATQNISSLQTSGLWPGDLGGAPTLMLNDGSHFNDATAGSGLNTPISCVSATAGDFDNDMDVDLYLACRTGAANIINRYYDNDGTGHFTLVPGAGGAGGPIGTNVANNAGTADSVVTADYDVDGFLDLFVTNGFNLRPKNFGGPSNLFHNLGNGNHWLELDLVGTLGTRDALGAIVQVSANGITQTRVVDGGYHRWSQNQSRLHVGLAGATRADVSIKWPGGSIDDYPNVAVNTVYRATEGGNMVATPPARGVPYACGAPTIDATVDRGAFVWKECYSGVWRVRFAAAGGSQHYLGQVASDVAIAAVNTVGGGNVLNLSDPKTLVFDIAESNSRLKGFNLTPGAGATGHCMTLQTPAGTPVFYGPLKERVWASDLKFEYGMSCAYVPPPPPPPPNVACGNPALNASTEAKVAVWKDCPGTQWHMRVTAGGLGFTTYSGTIDSSTGFASFAGESLEASDKLTLSPSTRLSFQMGTAPPGFDGASFVPNTNAATCFKLNLPAGATIVVGANRTQPAGNSFSLTTLGACGP